MRAKPYGTHHVTNTQSELSLAFHRIPKAPLCKESLWDAKLTERLSVSLTLTDSLRH